MRLIEVFNGGINQIFDIKNSYENRFSQINANDNIYIGIKNINLNGQSSIMLKMKMILFIIGNFNNDFNNDFNN